MMKKALSIFLAILLFTTELYIPAKSETASGVSVDAIVRYCNSWNKSLASKNLDVNLEYFLSDDKKSITYLFVTYNRKHQQANYQSGLIPSDSELTIMLDMSGQTIGFGIYSVDLKSELSKMSIYADDKVFSDVPVSSDIEQQHMWGIKLSIDDVLALYQLDEFTIRMTIDGKSEIIDIKYDQYSYLYDLLDWLFGALLYGDPAYDTYLSLEYLPEDAEPVATATPANNRGSGYSFREDLDGIDAAAQSVFYIEILDSQKMPIGTASGFVAFDEHLFITNQHVIQDASYLQVEGEDGGIYLLDTVLMSDQTHDIAILYFPDGAKYKALELDAEEELKRGQPIVTIGNPIGYRGTVAYGNISAFPVMPMYGNLKCIQFTAPTSHGSSGGCLFDDSGKVIGITSAIGISGITGEVGNDIGLAVPIDAVLDLYEKWDKVSYEKLGTERSWNMIGVTPTPSPTPTPKPTPTPTPTPTPVPTVEVTIGKSVRRGVYTGDEVGGIPHGYGVFESSDSNPALRYEGNWEKGEAQGKGSLKDEGYIIHFISESQGRFDRKGIYEGETLDGIPNGEGSFATQNANGDKWVYTGAFEKGTFNGYGESVWDSGYVEKGNYVAGEFSPTWSQLIGTLAGTYNYYVYKNSASFMENNENLFTEEASIAPEQVDREWQYSKFRMNPSKNVGSLVKAENLVVLQVDNYSNFGREYSALLLQDSDEAFYFGFIDGKCELKVDSIVEQIYLLPLNYVSYTTVSNITESAVFCSYVKLGNWEAPVAVEKPVLTPTPEPTFTAPTAAPTATPILINYSDSSEYKIELSKSVLEILPGENKAIKATAVALDGSTKKNATLVWTSSDDAIATVSKSGQIKAIAPGIAIITCASDSDENVFSIVFAKVLQPVTGISAESKEVTLVLNDELNSEALLKVVIEPADASIQDLEWKSGNSKVVTVDENGKLRAVGPGIATVTVSSLKNAGKKVYQATCKVTVSIQIEEIKDSIAEETLKLDAGKTKKLSPTILPENATNKKLSWSSNNEQVATVDQNGNVKATKPGACVITCAASQGNANCKYSVRVVQPITKLNNRGNFIARIREQLYLYPAIEIVPENATDKSLEWNVERVDLKSAYSPAVKDGVVTIQQEGQYKITASVKGNKQISTSFFLNVLPEDLNTLSISQNCFGQWDNAGNDQLKIHVEVENQTYGNPILAFELYAYATNTWGQKVYGETIYYLTTEKTVNPGKKVYSDYLYLPNRSQITRVYFGIHKVKLWDGTTVTYEGNDIQYVYWEIK